MRTIIDVHDLLNNPDSQRKLEGILSNYGYTFNALWSEAIDLMEEDETYQGIGQEQTVITLLNRFIENMMYCPDCEILIVEE